MIKDEDKQDFFRHLLSGKPFVKKFKITDKLECIFKEFTASDDDEISNFCDNIEDIKIRNIVRIFSSLLFYKKDYSAITIKYFKESEDFNTYVYSLLEGLSSSDLSILSNKYESFLSFIDTMVQECMSEDF